MSETNPTVECVASQVFAIDTGYVRPGLAACHAVQTAESVYLVDCGPGSGIPAVLAGLRTLGMAPDDVSHVILTHIHLDHAGGVGTLLDALPRARVVVHPRAARHLVDPSRLIAGSIAVYGADLFQQLYGDVRAVPAERLHVTTDDEAWTLGGHTLRFLHTEGHAKHHHCIVDEGIDGVFTGDTFGISYRELRGPGRPFVMATTTPVDFDPHAAHQSIDRIVATGVRSAFLTHYSRVDGLADLAPDLHDDIQTFVTLASLDSDACVDQMMAHWSNRARALGCTLEDGALAAHLVLDARLNADGLAVWWSRQKREMES